MGIYTIVLLGHELIAFWIAEVSFDIPSPFALYGEFLTFAHIGYVGMPPGCCQLQFVVLFGGKIGVEEVFVLLNSGLEIVLVLGSI